MFSPVCARLAEGPLEVFPRELAFLLVSTATCTKRVLRVSLNNLVTRRRIKIPFGRSALDIRRRTLD